MDLIWFNIVVYLAILFVNIHVLFIKHFINIQQVTKLLIIQCNLSNGLGNKYGVDYHHH